MKFRWQNAVILAVICAVVGCAVALTWSVASPRIEAKANATAEAARLSLFPDAQSFEGKAVSEDSGIDNFYVALKDGKLSACICNAEGLNQEVSAVSEVKTGEWNAVELAWDGLNAVLKLNGVASPAASCERGKWYNMRLRKGR